MKRVYLICLVVLFIALGSILYINSDYYKTQILKGKWYITIDTTTYYLNFTDNKVLLEYDDDSIIYENNYYIKNGLLYIDSEERSFVINKNKLQVYDMTFYHSYEDSLENKLMVAEARQNEEYDITRFTEITEYELKDKLDNKDDFYVLMARSNCYYCKIFRRDVVKSLDEYNYQIYYLDSRKIENEEMILNIDGNQLNSIVTPVIFHINDGKITSMQVGAMFYLEYINYFRSEGFKLK